MEVLAGYFRRVFTVDLRALAFMRIGVGFFLLLDLYTRATDLQAHYANDGVLPLHVLFQHAWNPYHLSLHAMSGLWQVQAFLFAVAAFFAVCLLVGYRTRLATIASWVLLLSVQNRNPFILQGGDDLIRMLLFWAIFLPWGKLYSLDAGTAKPQTYRVLSAATAGYILQVWAMYFFTAQLKSGPEWTTEYTALYYALSLDMIALPVGKLIYPYPELLKFLTFATWWAELLVPFLLFVPFRNGLMRLIVIGTLFSFHIGVSLTLFVGLFYIISMVSLLGMLPPAAMDRITARDFRFAEHLTAQLRRLFAFVRSPLQISFQLKVARPAWLQQYGGRLREGLLLLCIVYGCWWNFDNSRFSYTDMPQALRWPGYVLRLDQNWGMFAPAVFKDDGWFILEATTPQQLTIDLSQQGNEVSYAKAESVVSLFKNDRWRKYSENYLFVWNDFLRPYYCNFMLRTWNEQHPQQQVDKLEVVYMKEVSLPDYKVAPLKREVLCSCAKEK